mmetsp:Transcript_31376/g.65657  ORF Transcript_31376/g.65657 Transcript_31376/m.65657 type:complete len:119 (+) Transcript_31376:910-1266(+)
MNLGAGNDDHGGLYGNKDNDDGEGATLLNCTFLQGGGLPRNHGYLDNCSTITVFINGDLLDNIQMVNKGMKINCNAGVVRTNQHGDYRGVNTWYLPEGIANIFSMHELEQKYRITYNS